MKTLIDILMFTMAVLIATATMTNTPLLGGIGIVIGLVILMTKEGRRRF